ncbi:BamA/TamA family outer membrane protein [Flavobacterium aciduliphilum]|uniref:Outer membrane protein assembly factor BamA n=1 Tax=Flavobacterium aciduliphilum TaxID=1101402 RepID=A0A328YKZ3_9FLAO|nr:hypothetical protein [Flavobacterium aciduliphilum]RAR70806.1 hypothetical protein CLV55_10957 [Flavobacterium aciduliphilum]
MAQTNPSSKSDSLYKKIETYADNRPLFRLVHKLLFKPDVSEEKNIQKKQKHSILVAHDYSKYSGKIIRNIQIETFDPFGFSVTDPTLKPSLAIERLGNDLHIKTKKWTIRNLLLFKKHEVLDSVLIKESERLIRSQRYVRSVVIVPIPLKNNKDTIDVSVRVLDTWSGIVTGATSSSKANLDFTERNIFGLGHELDFNYLKSFTNNTAKPLGYDTKYTVPNFKNTYIRTTLAAKNDLNDNTYRSVRIDRPFYSTLTHWAGGFYYNYNAYSQNVIAVDETAVLQNFKTKTYEGWGAHAFNIFGTRSEFAIGSHLIFAMGYSNTSYLNRPDVTLDPISYFASSKTALATLGISSQRYYQDTYLFRFGTVEDIPYGKVLSITGGVENKNNTNRPYLGSRFSYGSYFTFGYLQGNVEYGTFFNHGKREQTTLKIEANYFTDLIPLGSWHFRQFIKPVLVLGSNRLDTSKDRLTLVDVNGIPGFNSAPLIGTKKFLTTFQTQMYNQKNWYGFNFSPFFNVTLGFLDEGNNVFFGNKMYSQIGVGMLVNNSYLVFSSFQLSFSYYPSLPIDGSNIIKTNAFQNSNIEFHDFQIGQPYVVPYQ